MKSLYRDLRSLVTLPLVLLLLYVINMMTSPWDGMAAMTAPWYGWWRWAALGIGIAWVIHLLRVLRALVLVGGLAGLAAILSQRR